MSRASGTRRITIDKLDTGFGWLNEDISLTDNEVDTESDESATSDEFGDDLMLGTEDTISNEDDSDTEDLVGGFGVDDEEAAAEEEALLNGDDETDDMFEITGSGDEDDYDEEAEAAAEEEALLNGDEDDVYADEEELLNSEDYDTEETNNESVEDNVELDETDIYSEEDEESEEEALLNSEEDEESEEEALLNSEEDDSPYSFDYGDLDLGEEDEEDEEALLNSEEDDLLETEGTNDLAGSSTVENSIEPAQDLNDLEFEDDDALLGEVDDELSGLDWGGITESEEDVDRQAASPVENKVELAGERVNTDRGFKKTRPTSEARDLDKNAGLNDAISHMGEVLSGMNTETPMAVQQNNTISDKDRELAELRSELERTRRELADKELADTRRELEEMKRKLAEKEEKPVEKPVVGQKVEKPVAAGGNKSASNKNATTAHKNIEVEKPIKKPIEKPDFSGMSDDRLWKFMKVYLEKQNVAKKPVDASRLNNFFGSDNVRRMRNKGYIIAIGNAYTFGNNM